MDTHYRVMTDGETVWNESFPFNSKSETIKGSNISCNVHGCTVRGGVEDCIDFVRGGKYKIEESRLIAGPRTRAFITAKGGIDGLLVKNVWLEGKVRWCDINLGDHTIYNKRKLMGMKNVVLDGVRRVDGKPVKVRVWDCEKPVCINGNYKVVVIPKWLVRIYMWILG